MENTALPAGRPANKPASIRFGSLSQQRTGILQGALVSDAHPAPMPPPPGPRVSAAHPAPMPPPPAPLPPTVMPSRPFPALPTGLVVHPAHLPPPPAPIARKRPPEKPIDLSSDTSDISETEGPEQKKEEETHIVDPAITVAKLTDRSLFQPVLRDSQEVDEAAAEQIKATITAHGYSPMGKAWLLRPTPQIGVSNATTCVLVLVKGTMTDGSAFYAVTHRGAFQQEVDIFSKLKNGMAKKGMSIRNAEARIIAFSRTSEDHVKNYTGFAALHPEFRLKPQIIAFPEIGHPDDMLGFTNDERKTVFSNESHVAAGFDAAGNEVLIVKCGLPDDTVKYYSKQL